VGTLIGAETGIKTIAAVQQPMSLMGQERLISPVCNISALPPEADVTADIVLRRFVPILLQKSAMGEANCAWHGVAIRCVEAMALK
jgi:hypothetical protein